MMDTGAKLERMANEIAGFFKSYPRDEAVAGIQDHIKSFWAPRMRQDLVARAASHPDGVDPLVAEALLRFSAAKSPTDREAAGPAEVGQIGASDAG